MNATIILLACKRAPSVDPEALERLAAVVQRVDDVLIETVRSASYLRSRSRTMKRGPVPEHPDAEDGERCPPAPLRIGRARRVALAPQKHGHVHRVVPAVVRSFRPPWRAGCAANADALPLLEGNRGLELAS
jgi:hypothetical protein